MECVLSLFILTLVCHTSVALNWKYEYNGYEYHITESVSTTTDWYSARAACMDEGGDLVTIETSSEDDQIFLFDTPFKSNLWIGLNNLDRGPEWTWADFKTSSLDNWYSGEPRVNELCGLRLSVRSHYWYSENCGEEKGFICKRPKGVVTPKTTVATTPVGGYCPAGWTDPGTDRCYKAYGPLTTSIKWSKAQSLCKELDYHGADLACANTQNEASSLTIMAALRPSNEQLWIGLYRNYYSTDVWRWCDNTLVTVENFHDSYSIYDDGCGFTSSSLTPVGSWDVDGTCTYSKNAYICQILKDRNNYISTPAPTSPNLCQSGFIPFGDNCYLIDKVDRTYTEAVSTCSQRGAMMVSVHGAAQNAFIQFSMLDVKLDKAWLGLTYTSADHVYTWENGWYVNYVNWGPDQPTFPSTDTCVEVQSMGSTWYGLSCGEKRSTICMTTNGPAFTPPPAVDGRCPSNDWVEFGGHCYNLCARCNRNWLATAVQCTSIYPGAQLASIHDDPTHLEITKLLRDDYSTGDSWIGLHKSAVNHQWVWQDGSPLQYTRWAPGHPEEDPSSEKNCAYLEMGGVNKDMWVSSTCTYSRGQVCEMDKLSELTTPVPGLGSCPSSEWSKYGPYCYLFRPDVFVTWSDAVRACEEEGGPRSVLARIDNFSQNDYIHYNMRTVSHLPVDRNYWIGLSKVGQEADYRWMDGEVAEFDHWAAGQPSATDGEDCVQTNLPNGLWHNEKCGEPYGYVCRYELYDEGSTASTLTHQVSLIPALLILILN